MSLWFVLLTGTFTLAQDFPRAEVFGGYSHVSADFAGSGRANLNGWNGALTGNFNRWLGVTTDLMGVYDAQDVTNTLGVPCPPFCSPFHLRTHAYTFLFGPQISLRSERFTPFAHALFGVAHTTESLGLPLATPAPNVAFSYRTRALRRRWAEGRRWVQPTLCVADSRGLFAEPRISADAE